MKRKNKHAKAEKHLASQSLKTIHRSALEELSSKELENVLGGNIIGDFGHKISEKWRSYDSAEQLKIIGGFIASSIIIGLGIAFRKEIRVHVNNGFSKNFGKKKISLNADQGSSNIITQFDDYDGKQRGVIISGVLTKADANGKRNYRITNSEEKEFLMTEEAHDQQQLWREFVRKELGSDLPKKAEVDEIIPDFKKLLPNLLEERNKKKYYKVLNNKS